MIISGANLSNDYFTTRIDRYVLFEDCPELINYYEEYKLFPLFLLDSSLSYPIIALSFFLILERFRISVHTFWIPSFKGSSSKTHKEFRDSVVELMQTGGSMPPPTEGNVMIYPTFQQEALNLISDYSAVKNVLQTATNFPNTDLYLTSGYVNFPRELINLLSNYPSEMKFLFAAPQANSFFHDPGFSSIIPALYNIVLLWSPCYVDAMWFLPWVS